MTADDEVAVSLRTRSTARLCRIPAAPRAYRLSGQAGVGVAAPAVGIVQVAGQGPRVVGPAAMAGDLLAGEPGGTGSGGCPAVQGVAGPAGRGQASRRHWAQRPVSLGATTEAGTQDPSGQTRDDGRQHRRGRVLHVLAADRATAERVSHRAEPLLPARRTSAWAGEPGTGTHGDVTLGASEEGR
jgi:hypothetical protein